MIRRLARRMMWLLILSALAVWLFGGHLPRRFPRIPERGSGRSTHQWPAGVRVPVEPRTRLGGRRRHDPDHLARRPTRDGPNPGHRRAGGPSLTDSRFGRSTLRPRVARVREAADPRSEPHRTRSRHAPRPVPEDTRIPVRRRRQLLGAGRRESPGRVHHRQVRRFRLPARSGRRPCRRPPRRPDAVRIACTFPGSNGETEWHDSRRARA